MTKNKKLEKAYQAMIDWNLYRAEQNGESLTKLTKMLSELDRSLEGDETYAKDIVDLDAMKIIYETSIRNFEGQVDKYRQLINELEK